MDPPSSPTGGGFGTGRQGGGGGGPAPATGGVNGVGMSPLLSPRGSADPPEEVFEMATRRTTRRPSPSSPSSFRKNNGISRGRSAASGGYGGRGSSSALMEPSEHDDGDDRRPDEFEMEGLIMPPPPPPPPAASRVGGGGGGGGRIRSASATVVERCVPPVVAACSLAWNPRNRSRSAVALLFLALLCLIKFARDEVSVFGGGGTGGGGSRKNNRHDPLSRLSPDERRSVLRKVYGSWTFYDGSAEDRPSKPYMTVANAGNPYLDLPEDKFPEESWQADAVYANHFLDAAEKLVRRGQQALFTTYHGYGLSNVRVSRGRDGDMTVDYELEDADERVSLRQRMFHVEEVDLASVTSIEELRDAAPSWEETGGWTTERSFDGLERRIIHAIMTESKFTVVIAGSWQSMGYGGNHAWQGMAGVFEAMLKGLFEKLGVELVVRAIGPPPIEELSVEERAELWSGGRSTLAQALGWSSIYGSDVDMVVWDDYSVIDDHDGDVESSRELDELSKQLFDLFARQALLSGDTNLPFIWGGDFEVLRNLHEHADADVGQLGNGMVGVPETTSKKAANNLPWAAQYLKCPENMQDICSEHRFATECWIGRSDVDPPILQSERAHILPTAVGWRMHQLKAYTLAYVFLSATLDALTQWSTITIAQGFPLPDEYWHVGEYIQNVQEKVKALDEEDAPHCLQLQESMGLPERMCRNRMKGRTEHTPRANPKETSVRSLLDSTQRPKNKPQLLYKGEDVENPVGKIPRGEVDALEILELGGKRRRHRTMLRASNVTYAGGDALDDDDDTHDNSNSRHRRRTFAITPGDGWQHLHGYGDGCDGSLSSSSTCGRSPSSRCLLEGHQGSRGGIWGNETTGWLLLQNIKAEHRYIALNLEVGGRKATKMRRELSESLPDSFVLEYLVEGAITTLKKDQFLEKLQRPVPGMGLLTIMDDEMGKEAKDVVVGIRVMGCPAEVECQIGVTHVYWS